MMNNSCKAHCGICDEISGSSLIDGYDKIVAKRENIIAETDNYLIIPSVGPLNESHVMLVPKLHVNSFASINDKGKCEAKIILQKLNDFMIKEKNRNLVFFESGAGENIDHSGGCIFHAHIHCVYHTSSFEDALNKEINFTRVNDAALKPDTRIGYVWYMNSKDEEFICNNPLLPSQFLRYLYSSSNLIHGNWNWRRDNNINGIKKVINTYANFSL